MHKCDVFPTMKNSPEKLSLRNKAQYSQGLNWSLIVLQQLSTDFIELGYRKLSVIELHFSYFLVSFAKLQRMPVVILCTAF
jgi:hypothetical protein